MAAGGDVESLLREELWRSARGAPAAGDPTHSKGWMTAAELMSLNGFCVAFGMLQLAKAKQLNLLKH